jgi:hypothetical protein
MRETKALAAMAPEVQRIYADMALVNAFYYLEHGALPFGDWEWVNLKEGLDLYGRGRYLTALRLALHAVTPPDRRSKEERYQAPESGRGSLAVLRTEYNGLRASPLVELGQSN